jgi:hypothetical protein
MAQGFSSRATSASWNTEFVTGEMKMRYGRIISALALALLLGLAAQPALAQHRAGGPYYGGPRYNAAARAQNRQAMRAARQANAHPPQHNVGGPQHAANGPQTNGAAARPPQNYNAANGAQSASRPPQGTAGESSTHPPAAGGSANGVQNANDARSAQLPGTWTQRLGQMSPQQQAHFLQNNERFKSLPPEKQQQIRQNLQNYNRLSPTERNALKDRQATWEHMSPDQRNYVQHTLLPKWQQMSPDRKQAVTDRLHTLQGMTAEDRQKSLNDPQFMRGLNPDEQSVLRGLDQVRNPSSP